MDDLMRHIVEDLARGIDQQLGTVHDSMKTLLGFTKKAELEKYCRTLTIDKEDLASLVYAAGTIGYTHDIKSFEHVPAHLSIDSGELCAAFSEEAGNPISPQGRNMVNKIDSIFKQRRYAAAHLFVSSSRWHIFYFDFRDIEEQKSNHWKYGSHIHFVNDLWANLSMSKVWDSLAGRSNKSYGLHVRFVSDTGDFKE